MTEVYWLGWFLALPVLAERLRAPGPDGALVVLLLALAWPLLIAPTLIRLILRVAEPLTRIVCDLAALARRDRIVT